jgi:uncharacterized protein
VHIATDDAFAVDATRAIHAGDIGALAELLTARPEIATAHVRDDGGCHRTMLHIATDWPGHFPNVAASIQLLVQHGADVDAAFVGDHPETPLHWAASSDDVAALDALLDAGADIEAPGAVLGRGSPLQDACGFGQWKAARRLVERGAITRLQDAASLGMIDRMEAILVDDQPDAEVITIALWYACNASQRDAAVFLLDRGADLNWVGWDHRTPLDLAIANDDSDFADWLRNLGAIRATPPPER